MLQISIATRLLCGVALVTVPTIEFGGVFLLRLMRTRDPGYVDNRRGGACSARGTLTPA